MKTVFKRSFSWVLIPLVLAVIGPMSLSAMETEDCLGCHSETDVVGDELYIDADRFDHTVHSEMGCVTCHASVTDEHPDDGEAVSRAVCLECHEEVGNQYLQTAHADYAVCGDCHNPHQVRGLEAVSGHEMNEQCSLCHDDAGVAESHAEWLPQADLHIALLPCITCHTSSNDYEIVLNITHKQEKAVFGSYQFAGYAELEEYSQSKEVQTLIDLNGDSFISLAELRTFNLNPAYKHMRLEGTLVPSELSHDLSTLDNRYDCTFCHASGPESMQTSFLMLPLQNGGYQRLEVEKGAVLDALYGTPDFYMTGSTRSASMNIIGLIIICCGLIMPVGHGTLRFLTRKNRQEKGE